MDSGKRRGWAVPAPINARRCQAAVAALTRAWLMRMMGLRVALIRKVARGGMPKTRAAYTTALPPGASRAMR
jgi:hypothetical protein